jgi:hypothetical protein
MLARQNKLPDARVVYCSATGASEPRNMGYMTRLGLWGAGTDFPHFSSFLAALEKRGVGALELVAMDMKARLRTSSHILSVLARVLIPTRTEEVEHKYSSLSLFGML